MRKQTSHQSDSDSVLADASAAWFVKLDRGLTPSESKQLQSELKNDPQLAEQIESHRSIQQRVAELPSYFVDDLLGDLSKPRLETPWWRSGVGMAAAAVVMLSLTLSAWLGIRHFQSSADAFVHASLIEATESPITRILSDGSLVRMNTHSTLKIAFSTTERRIDLLNGESHFSVVKDSDRPFSVFVNGVRIQAVGTAFNVKMADRIEVIVTEGTISISEQRAPSMSEDTPVVDDVVDNPVSEEFFDAGSRVEIVNRTGTRPLELAVFKADGEEIDERLQWRKSLLTLEGETLLEISQSFEQKTGCRMIIIDNRLHEFKIGGRFPSDDVMSFLRILETAYHIPSKQIEPGVYIVGDESAPAEN